MRCTAYAMHKTHFFSAVDAGELPPHRLHHGGVLETEGQGRSYAAAAGEAVATNASQPWTVLSAIARDAVHYLADHLPGRQRRQQRREEEFRDEEQGNPCAPGVVSCLLTCFCRFMMSRTWHACTSQTNPPPVSRPCQKCSYHCGPTSFQSWC